MAGSNDQSKIGSVWGAGDIMYRDLNGDGIVDKGNSTATDHGDLKKIGNSTPRLRFGLSLGTTGRVSIFKCFSKES